jgi:hypothetical protein
MEPETRSTHTHIERERGGSSGLAFIVGGLVVAVAVIAYFLLDGGATLGGGEADTNISVEATGESPAPAAPAESDGTETEAAPAEGGAETEPAPAAPAPANPQN